LDYQPQDLSGKAVVITGGTTGIGRATALRMLKAEDIDACIHYCLVQPERCDVIAVQIRPHLQSNI
jgi:NAD(P)-dependent dehydrogenase (short-subunit alcohol dehydrogenase family)